MTEQPIGARRTALVTGGSRGIGRAIAVRLAHDGFDVAFCYRGDHDAAAQTASLVEAAGRRTVHQVVDVADPDAVRQFTERAEERLGPVSAAVSCAGIHRDRAAALMSDADWSDVVRTNLDGAFHLSRSVLMGMFRRRTGALVLISSVAGLGGTAGQANYAASKAGLHGLCGSLAKEAGRYGVRANVVAPGYIESDMVADLSPRVRKQAEAAVALGGFGKPAQVADAVSFLVSDRASYITGAVLRVDGGLTV
ncbi:3-oxoacyl-ACP reductase FabG [Streptomyces sp. OfavH-34-F]|uniref:3-oxoacyl-ACP reductase FabG n=1 Tax=Streptomyces sp. OfavH-34-F TaxID=2917760 RepID=UPI001EF161F0|nr:3-oxoacyl-ACP reductase FabG [Streptomyces sp. OfavH-34-F]MCG7524787.1 3-oxoacyl-ACP reductase FabG [Streptomyces sp. OfavH-34-F]